MKLFRILSTGWGWLGMPLRANHMLDAIAIFLAGLVCGIITGRVRLRRQRNKIKLYESYIHRRLQDAVPRAKKDLELR